MLRIYLKYFIISAVGVSSWLSAPTAVFAGPCDSAPTPACIIEEAVETGRSGGRSMHIKALVEAGLAWRQLGWPEHARDRFDQAFALWRENPPWLNQFSSIQMARSLIHVGDSRGFVILDELTDAILANDGPWPSGPLLNSRPAEPSYSEDARGRYLSRELGILVKARGAVGDLDGAMRTAALMPGDAREAYLIAKAAGSLAKNDYKAEAATALGVAREKWRAGGDSDEWENFKTVVFSKPLAWLGRLGEALAYADAPLNEEWRDSEYSSTAGIYMERGDLKTARKIIDGIRSDRARENALGTLAFYHAQAGDTEQAKMLLAKVSDQRNQRNVYNYIAKIQAVQGDIDGAIKYLEKYYHGRNRADLLMGGISIIAKGLVEVGDTAGAKRVFGQLDRNTKPGILPAFASMHARSGNVEDALALARSAGNRRTRYKALINVALGMEGKVCFYWYSAPFSCE